MLTVTHVLNLAMRAYAKNEITLGSFDTKLRHSIAEADARTQLVSLSPIRNKLGQQ